MKSKGNVPDSIFGSWGKSHRALVCTKGYDEMTAMLGLWTIAWSLTRHTGSGSGRVLAGGEAGMGGREGNRTLPNLNHKQVNLLL